ncbi:MAG: cyanophycinase [Idiomarina sp.]|nr:cyanophycinase [Idiomarina sp.]
MTKTPISGLRNIGAALTTLFTAVLFSTQVSAESATDETDFNLVLLGSDPQVCSSMNQDACASKDWIQANEMRTSRLFNLSDVRRREAMRQAVWPREREAIREELIETLEMMADHFGYGVVPEYRLVERFRSRAHLDLLSRLTEEEYYRVLDGLEMPTMENLQEVARISESTDSGSAIVARFVQSAAQSAEGEAPVIYVVTAAQRDPLGAYQSYQAILRDAGAQVKWLPIDATVLRAQANGQCDSLDSLRRRTTGAYDRARVHPDLHAEQKAFCEDADAWQGMLAEADGIFFADGNQSLLRDAFFSGEGERTALLKSITSQLNDGELKVAAAGNAAIAMSSGTMVTNGSSREAMTEGSLARPAPRIGCEQDDSCPRGVSPNSLTYHAMGGLGLYPFGMIDVEISERGRQGRMLRLATDTAMPLASGIDRATALLVNTRSGQFEVMGDSAVFFVEQPTGNERMVGGAFHFVRHASTGVIQRNRVSDIQLAEQQAYRPESTTTRFLGDTGVYDNIARLCEGREQLQLLQEDFVFLMQAGEDTETKRAQGRCQVVNGTVGIAWQP